MFLIILLLKFSLIDLTLISSLLLAMSCLLGDLAGNSFPFSSTQHSFSFSRLSIKSSTSVVVLSSRITLASTLTILLESLPALAARLSISFWMFSTSLWKTVVDLLFKFDGFSPNPLEDFLFGIAYRGCVTIWFSGGEGAWTFQC